ncbi:hypothetical protein BD779DRAFT_56372 [Infundibulicybe gibba]|nr:hypothetical protein BD779DRAFT_56372 [Infundibulicybe gibba]
MDTPSVPTKVKNKTRQKRILPSRSRRGGPGVGSCDADLLILDTQKRKLEHEPLIPIDTPFILTTNNALVAESSNATKLGINAHANHRYFDRPEVLRAYREQQIIQTPEFINVADIPSVGGRFRPRGLEDETADTSDAAYEKRHRKYESFEKRQRLREKEKLKYEQYKLKERIEQLRAMDGGAFLTLPASSFSPAPPRIDEEQDDDDEDEDEDADTTAAYREGERRRSEMLDIASGLEERYRVLLPPERMKQTSSYTKPETSSRKEAHGSPDISDNDLRDGHEKKEVEKIKLKIKFPARVSHTAAQVSALPSNSESTISTRRKTSLSATVPVTARQTRTSHALSISEHEPPVLSFTPTNPSPRPDISEQENASPVEISCPKSKPYYTTTDSSTDDNPTSWKASAEASEADWDETSRTDEILDAAVSSPPQKRPRVSYSPTLQSARGSSPFIDSISAPEVRRSASRPTTVHTPSAQYAGAASKAERPSSLLLIAAIRQSGSRARKTGRHVGAFGTKLPNELEQHQDYELPAWILQDHFSLDRGADEYIAENNNGATLSEPKIDPNDHPD